jgi:hypothetical protein
VTMAVRREIDDSADVINLRRLLRQISKRPDVLSRARYLELFAEHAAAGGPPIEHWSRNFTKHAGTGDIIDIRLVKKHIKQLDAACKTVKLYADRVVAHQTEQQIQANLNDVNRALQEIETVLRNTTPY